MKKLILILAALALVATLTLTACDSGTPDTDGTTAAETTGENTPAGTTATTEATTTTPAGPTKTTYKITVLDQNGAPVKGVEVQMCDDAGCKLPNATGDDGSVSFSFSPSNYHVTLITIPEGYTADTEEQHNFPEGSSELTITIQKN